MSAKTSEPMDNSDKSLVLLLTVKHEQKADCSGGYIKLLSSIESREKFNTDSQYEIMFGPDICSGTRKVQAILRHNNINLAIDPILDITSNEFTHQYVFVLNPDDTFEILVDRESLRKGNVTDFWKFEQQSKKIEDKTATKPRD